MSKREEDLLTLIQLQEAARRVMAVVKKHRQKKHEAPEMPMIPSALLTVEEIEHLGEDYNSNAEFVIFNKKTRAILGTARGFDQAKTKASSIRKQRGLKFDDVSFMTSRRFYGNTSAAPSGGRRIEYAPRYNLSKRGRFRGMWHPDGSYADLD